MRVALEKPENGSPDARGKGRKCIQEIGYQPADRQQTSLNLIVPFIKPTVAF